MAKILDLAQLAQFAYEPTGKAPPGWIEVDRIDGRYGFRAVAYVGGGETVVAFRGTNLSKDDLGGSAGDVAADAMLGVGMNTSHFSQAEAFIADLHPRGPITLSGHSLGGAIAQIVGNRRRLPFATFNAPGVAVVASRNAWEMVGPGAALRAGGALLSSVIHPMQAMRDVRSAFYRVTGVNVRLYTDLVSMVGVHYGKVVSVPGTNRVLPQHSIDTVVEVLKTNAIRTNAITDLCPPP